jgi:hypothetical protein
MQTLVWPERQRCRHCRRYFGFTVIQGLYCSRECAGLPTRSDPVPFRGNLADLPRECRNTNWRGARPKVRYVSEQDALEVADEMDSTRRKLRPDAKVYQCSHCGYYHIGHGKYRKKHA